MTGRKSPDEIFSWPTFDLLHPAACALPLTYNSLSNVQDEEQNPFKCVYAYAGVCKVELGIMPPPGLNAFI